MGISFRFCLMTVYCMFSLESPHRGDSNEYTQYTIFNMKKEKHPKYPKFAAMGFFSKGLKNEFKTALVNEPSVFEPLKFYCSYVFDLWTHFCLTCDEVQEELLYYPRRWRRRRC